MILKILEHCGGRGFDTPTGYPIMKTILKQQLGLPECPYMDRWVINCGLFSIRVHHWRKSDDKRYFHDHPWWYLTLVLSGSYIDVSPNGKDIMSRWRMAFRPALHRHTVEINSDVWTLLITGPEIRKWGFWVNGKFKKANKYFFEQGHHPCTDGQTPVRAKP